MQPLARRAGLMSSSRYYRVMNRTYFSLRCIVAAIAVSALSVVHAQIARPFLWELSKEGKTMTLFGSLHVGKPDFYPIPAAVIKRFEEATVLAVEADVTLPETQQACTKLAATDEKLESMLSGDDFAALSGYMKASNLPESTVNKRKLWMVNLALVGAELNQLGVDFGRGLDIVFLRDAKSAKKRVVEVEGGALQCGALAGASNAETTAALTRFLAAVRQNRMEKRLDQMLIAYRAGDGLSLNKVVIEEFGDSKDGLLAKQRVFDNRHPAMAEKIASFFKSPERYFVVIGVGHMFGDNNLLEALDKLGITVKRVE